MTLRQTHRQTNKETDRQTDMDTKRVTKLYTAVRSQCNHITKKKTNKQKKNNCLCNVCFQTNASSKIEKKVWATFPFHLVANSALLQPRKALVHVLPLV